MTVPSLSFALADSSSVNVFSHQFKDIPSNSPYISAINFVSSQGIMNGYPDGTFQQFGTLTRAELAVSLVRLLGYDLEAQNDANESTGFTDDKSIQSWARGAVNVLKNKNFIHGYPDGSFKPEQKLDQASVLSILVRALGYPDLYSNLGWPNQYIKAAETLYITQGLYNIRPDKLASRGFTAQLLSNTALIASGDDLTASPDPAMDYYGKLDRNSTEYKLTMALGLYGQNYILNRLPASFMGIVTNFSSDTMTITPNIIWPKPSFIESDNTEVTFTYGKNVFLDPSESKDSIQSLNDLQVGSFADVVLGKDGYINYISATKPLPDNLPTQNPVPVPSPSQAPPPLTGTISSDDTGNRIFLTVRLVGPKGASQPFQSILDTGGDIGGFPQSVLDQVGYTPISQALVGGVGGQGQAAYVYRIQYPEVLDNGQWVPLGKGSMITIGYDDVLNPDLSPMVPPTIFKDNSGLSLSIGGSKWTLTFPSP